MKETWLEECQRRPKTAHQRCLRDQVTRNMQSPFDCFVMRQVTVAPERLRDSQQNTQSGGESAVHPRRSEEGPVDEIVRNRV